MNAVCCGQWDVHEPGLVSQSYITARGVTAHRLDYWVNRGLVSPVGQVRPGSGHTRHFTAAEAEVAITIGRLTEAGLLLAAAHRVARGGQLAPGVEIIIREVT